MSRQLEFGDEGPDVQLLQEALVSLGYAEVGTPDGRYAGTTQEAMTRFQSEKQMFGDGRFGPDSQAALRAATSSAGTQDYFQALWTDGHAASATDIYGEAAAAQAVPAYGEAAPVEQWPDGQDQAWPGEGDRAWTGDQVQAPIGEQDHHVQTWAEDQEQAWSGQPGSDTGLMDGSGGVDADTMHTASAAQYPGAPAQRGSTPKVEFATGAAGVPSVNGSQMEFKVRNEGWINIEPMTKLGSYTVHDAGGTVVHGPVSIKNTIEIEQGHTYLVSHDIENIPGVVGALRDGDYTVKIELVAGARRSMKFKKHMGKVLP
jgi:peptidoglycan hydrolase-like protein with peptidoglycan-binding domain